MSTVLLEELEKLLSETNQEKQRLNFICETVWDLLNPPGTEKNGFFKVEKKDVISQSEQVCEETSKVSSSLGESLENATKLIALGKLVRDATTYKRVNPVSDVCNKSSLKTEKLEKTIQEECNKTNSSGKGLNKEVKTDKSLKKNAVKKSEFLSNKKSTILPKTVKHEVKTDVSSCSNTNEPKVTLKTECNSALSRVYSHSCSPTLSNFVNMLKIPEDLRCVLKHHRYYEKHKEYITFLEKSPKTSFQTFQERFINIIKLKLNNDLKTNLKHTERYVKYLDIAEDITKSKSGELYDRVEYTTVEDLQLYEERMNQIRELNIKMRLLNVVCNELSNLS